ncbi:iron transporter FeoA [Methanofervidicoccus sp. A16]|uniref:FeoA family protein n=1 Tax=Methanofervidicoccus sp. A16 TaxID=2607662 RepID=UPI001188E9B5|nr:FeoA family protein [Methanofervidicoccus sp. A16]AXI24715.1 iron transporter FeoA [Methanofervidicoccus sp. A16]MBW9220121.1 ferrous iron transport protein A [Methanothermococcus sp. SCGC AD-155-N22]
MGSLADKKPGTYIIKEIIGEYKKLYDLRIVPGTSITVISNEKDPMIVKIGNCKIAIGKDVAKSIIVE